MTTIFESFRALCHSKYQQKFRFSILALLLWISAIALTFLSGSYTITYGEYIITFLLAFAALMAIISIPKQQVQLSHNTYEHESDHVTQ